MARALKWGCRGANQRKILFCYEPYLPGINLTGSKFGRTHASMTYAPTNPLDVPPYQIQPLISILDDYGAPSIQVNCAQAFGSEVYVGCSNGDIMRFALQADDPGKVGFCLDHLPCSNSDVFQLESYSILSRQTILNSKPIDEIVLVPSISRALILSGTLSALPGSTIN